MNITTTADVKKFLTLIKAGLKHGERRELSNYTSATHHEGTSVVKSYYCSLELRFTVDAAIIDELFAEDDIDAQNQVDELMKGLGL